MNRLVVVSLLALAGSGGVWAQTGAGAGAVTGAVLEGAGDGIPDCSVVLSNAALGVRRVMNTSDDGVFDAPSLVPSAGYRLHITRKGFAEWDSGDFPVAVGQTVEYKVTLKHSEETPNDETNLPAPRVQEIANGVATLISAGQVDSLPSRDRRLDPLALQDPLAGVDHRSGRLMLAGEPSSNLFLTDGVATTNTYNGSTPGIANQLSQETVQEFQVLSATYSAEFGPAMGGVINAVTGNAGSQYHGAAYDYYSPQALAAADRFAPGRNLFQHQNLAGATIGGPIRHNLFFLGSVDVLDGTGAGLNRITTPLLADPYGISIPVSNCKATAIQCANALKFLESQMNVVTPLSDRRLTGFGKLDYRRSDRNSVSVSGNFMNASAPNGGSIDVVAPNGGLLDQVNATDEVRYGRAAWTTAPTGSTLNLMRAGWFQDRLYQPATPPVLSPTGARLAPAITLDGVTVGSPNPNASTLTEVRYQFTDNFTLTTNTHVLNVGADYWRTRDGINSMVSSGQYSFSSLTAFAQDLTAGGKDYTLLHEQLGSTNLGIPFKQWNLYAFDTWRPFSRLTVIAGVRFEKPLIPQPRQVNPNYYQTGAIASPNIDFAPRVSVAYRASDRMVLRVGYAWLYEPMPGRLLNALLLGNGVYQTDFTVTPNLTSALFFPNVTTVPGNIPNGSSDLMYSSTKLRNPYVRETSIAFERKLDRDTTATLTVLRNRGYRLYSVSDINLAAPTVTKTYAIDNAAGQQTGTYPTTLYTVRSDPRYAHIYDVANGGSSWYSAAFLELRRRMSHGVTVQASYTWSHAITDSGAPAIYGVLPLNLINGSTTTERANAPTDQRHRVAFNGTWQPTPHLLKGFALSAIGTYASGQPETPLVWVAGQQFSGTTMVYPTSINGGGGWGRVPFQPIGSLHTDALYNLDGRISRTIPIGERVKAVVMFESFNLLNRQAGTAIDTIAYTATPTTPPNGAVNGPTTGVLKPLPGVGNAIAAAPARLCQVALRLTF